MTTSLFRIFCIPAVQRIPLHRAKELLLEVWVALGERLDEIFDLLTARFTVGRAGIVHDGKIELCRDIAIRINNKYKKTFVVPDGRFLKEGARIMALDDPTKKMSKSAENIHSRISLLDEPSKIKKSIMKATTDSDGVVRFDVENKPGISNLLNIYSVLSGMTVPELEAKYEGKGYGDFKKDLVEVVVEALAPIKERYEQIRHSDELIEILKDGAVRADAIAKQTMKRVKENFGLGIE